jgi:hypothetical protein
MPDYDCHTYSVVPGEPHLGKVRECIVTYEQDEVIDAIIDAFLCGELDDTTSSFKLDDDTYVQIGEYLSYVDIERINDEVDDMFEESMTDDAITDELYSLLIKLGPDNWEYEVERTTYV